MIGIGIIIIVFALYFISLNKDKNFLSVRYYDVNGNLMSNRNLFSVFDIPSTAYSMALTVRIENNGEYPLLCKPLDFYPIEYKNNQADMNEKLVLKNDEREWTSNEMIVSQFFGKISPLEFKATVKCDFIKNFTTFTLVKEGSINLSIIPVCGNNKCESGEDSIFCPLDCFLGDRVIFRTNDITYSYNTHAIGYSNKCGDQLIAYGIESQTCWYTTINQCPSMTGFTLLLDKSAYIPGKPLWAESNPCLYIYSGSYNKFNKIALAWKIKTNRGPCGLINYWGVNIYSPDDPHRFNLYSNSSLTINKSMETFCGLKI